MCYYRSLRYSSIKTFSSRKNYTINQFYQTSKYQYRRVQFYQVQLIDNTLFTIKSCQKQAETDANAELYSHRKPNHRKFAWIKCYEERRIRKSKSFDHLYILIIQCLIKDKMSDSDLLECCAHIGCGQICTCCLQCCASFSQGNVKFSCSCICILFLLVTCGIYMNFIITYYVTTNQDLKFVDCKSVCGNEYVALSEIKCCNRNNLNICQQKSNCRETFMRQSKTWLTICTIMFGLSLIGICAIIAILCLDSNRIEIGRYNQIYQNKNPLLDRIPKNEQKVSNNTTKKGNQLKKDQQMKPVNNQRRIKQQQKRWRPNKELPFSKPNRFILQNKQRR